MVARTNPIKVYYEAPRVSKMTRGAGIEILFFKGQEYLIGHDVRGNPQIIGELKKQEPVPSGGFNYHYFIDRLTDNSSLPIDS